MRMMNRSKQEYEMQIRKNTEYKQKLQKYIQKLKVLTQEKE